jgi:hypothetical protein
MAKLCSLSATSGGVAAGCMTLRCIIDARWIKLVVVVVGASSHCWCGVVD